MQGQPPTAVCKAMGGHFPDLRGKLTAADMQNNASGEVRRAAAQAAPGAVWGPYYIICSLSLVNH